MRPLKLTMSAFGPYGEKTEIDFNVLGSRGLYLITGDTGAGKTTIYDAISFALFGEASGTIRTASTFRSKYADDETPTQVELLFSYKGKEYTVKRNPEYERMKSRGNGKTVEKANATLICPDGRVVTKQREVNAAIVEILGIDRDQFSQIAMIAQGDFRKLLFASTGDRIKIFRQLFHTDRFDVLQRKLKEAFRESDSQATKTIESIKQYVSGLECENDSPWSDMLFSAKQEEYPKREIMQLTKKLIADDEKKEEKSLLEKDELQKDLDLTKANIHNALELQSRKESLAKYKDALKNSENQFVVLKEALKKEESKKPEIKEIEKTIIKLEEFLPDYDNLEKERKTLSSIKKNIEENEKAKNQIISDSQQIKESVEKRKAELLNIENSAVEEKEVEKQKDDIVRKSNKLNALKNELDSLDKIEARLLKAQNIYREKSNDAAAKKQEYEKQNKAYLDGQAGILASDLEDNMPCPVCGSKTHPQLAKKLLSAPTKEELEKFKSNSEIAENAAVQASNACATEKASLKAKRESVMKTATELFENIEFDEIKPLSEKNLTETTQMLFAVTEKLKLVQLNLSRKKELEELLEKAQKNLQSLSEKLNETTNNLTEYRTKLEASMGNIKKVEEKLKYESKNQAENEIRQLKKTKEEMETLGEKAKKEFDFCRDNITTIKAKIQEIEKEIEDKKEIDIASQEEKLKEIEQCISQVEIELRSVHKYLDNNRSALKNITEKFIELEKKEDNLQCVKSLSDTANGNISGKQKIMLETYIQMTYFDRVLERANKRFLTMSGGQYEMKRPEQSANNQSQSGLDLNVVDHYNGSVRDIKSISGGESFKASLSLALGMADEIQASAGGIQLDTMFVDEGFGSLDSESINQSMDALADLAQGNRLVGIISHVGELKERIEKQIVVKKDKSGTSKITIIA